jgi:hypothetical protein
MLGTYPDWVREWIDQQGGLSERLITMSFEYASRHMKICDGEAPAQIARTERTSATRL